MFQYTQQNPWMYIKGKGVGFKAWEWENKLLLPSASLTLTLIFASSFFFVKIYAGWEDCCLPRSCSRTPNGKYALKKEKKVSWNHILHHICTYYIKCDPNKSSCPGAPVCLELALSFHQSGMLACCCTSRDKKQNKNDSYDIGCGRSCCMFCLSQLVTWETGRFITSDSVFNSLLLYNKVNKMCGSLPCCMLNLLAALLLRTY